MLDRALLFVKDALDSHLQRSLSLPESVVVLNHLRTNDGAGNQKNQNRLIMTLTKLEYDTSRAYYNNQQSQNGHISRPVPQFFNLNLLISANFDDYVESLKILSQAILFFQANNSFQRALYPHLPETLQSLDIEIEGTSEAKSYEMWGALGSSYLPSVLYKIRRLMMDSRQIAGFQTPMQEPLTEVGS